MKPHKIDPIARFPDHADAFGKAWRLNLDELRRKAGVLAENDAALDIWMIEAPWAHPFWHSYIIGLQHLRPVLGGDVIIHRPGATHEFFVAALNPDAPREPFMLGDASPAYLTPLNFVAQLVEESDEVARERVRDAVLRICAGSLSPDTDFRGQWVALYGGHMLRDHSRPEGAPLQ
ncbi:MAG: hypothetical protein B7Y80_01660 [Hyphomicrobium sp. 32-62-53]|nr:MAG: hypothetical protein B7Z29_02010 [Hyphomicrobium sp. 12-62-95]OYY01461.1 MAG: hypothetical protein B7Y80_01660 [Hyphomicrobium sp. 32-62-53]